MAILPNGNTFISGNNAGRSFQVNPDGDVVWEYVNTTDISRAFPSAYDSCPQLKAISKPQELKVAPPNDLEWHIQPDALRGNATTAVHQ